MTRAVRILAVAIAVAIGLAAPAPDDARAESMYNLVFLGERVPGGDTRALALGGEMQIVRDSLAVLQFNPAMLSYTNKVTFGASQFAASDLSQSATAERNDVTARFTNFAFAFPLFGRYAVGIGYRGKYDVGGSFSTLKTSAEGDEYEEIYSRGGALSSYQFRIATTITRYVRVGAFYSVENGEINNRWDIIFEDRSQQPAASLQTRTLSAKGWGFGATVRPLSMLVLGVAYEGEIDYDVDESKKFTNPGINSSSSDNLVLPARWTFSALWRATRDINVHAGGVISDFTDFEGLDFPKERLYREESASLGIEYLRGFPLFGKRFPIRLSATWERLPYDFPAGERVQRLVAGIGTGLNFSDGKGKIDFGLQTGKLGSVDSNGLETRILRLYIGVSGAEVWKRERTGAY